MGKGWSSMASHGDDFTPPSVRPQDVGSSVDSVHPVGTVGKSGSDITENTAAKSFDDYLQAKLPKASEDAILPVAATTKQTKTEEITSFVIENTCSAVAGEMLEKIHDFRDSCVSQILSTAINEILNKKLEESKKNQQAQQPQTKLAKAKGSCLSGTYDAGVEWIVKGATSNALDNISTNNNSTFQTNCKSCVSCIAYYTDVALNIKLHSTGSANNIASVSQSALAPRSTLPSSTAKSNIAPSPFSTSSSSSLYSSSFKK